MATNQQLSLAIQRSFEWHAGVEYGGGLVMTNQVNGAANAIDIHYKGMDKIAVLITALLSKAWETKRLNEETKNNPNARNSYDALVEDFGKNIADNIKAMSTEPDTKDWYEMAAWAEKQNPQVQAVLLAEKLQNFIVSRDNPNPKKEPAWHINYYNTRMIMVEALREACPALYVECVKVSTQGIKAQQRKIAEMEQAVQPIVVVKAENAHMSERVNSR